MDWDGNNANQYPDLYSPFMYLQCDPVFHLVFERKNKVG